MIDLYKCCRDNNIVINSLKKYDDNIIIYSNKDNIYLVKNSNISLDELFKYFADISFTGFELPIKVCNGYEIYFFYDELIFDKYRKAKELINCLIDLHSKGFSYIDFSDEKKEQIYNSYLNKIESVFSFYLKLHDSIEEMLFINPAYYLLLNNISKIYKLLRLSRINLDKWYKSSNNRIRECILVNNYCLNNFCCGKKKFFINWDNYKRDLLIFDFVDFYKNNYFYFDTISLFDEYNSKIKLGIEEANLLFSIICIPDLIDFNLSIYDNTLNVRKLINYVEVTTKFVLEEYKKYQETD